MQEFYVDEEILIADCLKVIRSWRMQLEGGEVPSSNADWTDFPSEAIIGLMFATGKHFGHPELLAELLKIQTLLFYLPNEGSATSSRTFLALLRICLDKHTDTYGHLSYIALPIFEQFQAEPPAVKLMENDIGFEALLRSRTEVIVALLCDLIHYELKTMLGQERRMQQYLPGMQKLKQRVYVSLRAVSTCVVYANHISLPAWTEDLIELWRQQTMQDLPFSETLIDRTLGFADHVLGQMDPDQRLLLSLTLIPVYVSHDEYLFIRTLQAFEMLFQVVAEGLRVCTSHIASERYCQATMGFRLLNELFRLSPAIFRVLSTMTSLTFNSFREYMRGASAIQSVYYKRIELYAAHPDPERFRTPSFESVPTVLEEYRQERFRNLQDVVAPLLMDELLSQDEEVKQLLLSMNALDKSFVAWKVTHYRLVKTLIGDMPGTGYTSGPPYLKQMLEYPLFPFLAPRFSETTVL